MVYRMALLPRERGKLVEAGTGIEPVHIPVLVIPEETLDKVKSSAQCFVAKSLSRNIDFL